MTNESGTNETGAGHEAHDDWFDPAFFDDFDSEVVDGLPKCRRCNQPAVGRTHELTQVEAIHDNEWMIAMDLPDPWLCLPCFMTQQYERALSAARESVAGYRDLGSLPHRFNGVRANTFIETPENWFALSTSQSWLDERARRNLIITGDVGTGKTHLAMVIRNELAHQKVPVFSFFMSEPRMSQVIKASFRDPAKQDAADRLIGLAKSAPVFILDDLGKSHGRDSSLLEEALYWIVDHRYNAQLPVVVTSEFHGGRLASRVGADVVSRLEHDAARVSLDEPAQSWRRPLELVRW